MAFRLFLLALSVAAPLAATAQDRGEREPADEPDRIELNLDFDYDPAELRQALEPRVQFKRLWGPVGIAGYHLPPAAESGPYRGPPLQIWSNGFGTSMWRDPVTGWPLQ